MPKLLAVFHPMPWTADSFWAFMLPESLLVLGSITAGIAVLKLASPWTAILVWSFALMTCYPTLYCLSASLMTDQAWIATAMMVMMSGGSLIAATMVGDAHHPPAAIRPVYLSSGCALAWTAVQTIIFWGVFLWVLPKGITEVESILRITRWTFPFQYGIAATIFLMASVLGLASGYALSVLGNGTPLPTATATELVAVGPYRWVRNPMAVAGITQGVAVGIGMGSISVVLYAVCGAIVWHNFVRPTEEAELIDRFGERYAAYRRSTPLWVPLSLGRSWAP